MPFYVLPTGGASPVLVGNEAPTGGIGNLNDLFLQKPEGILYGPKTVGGWSTGIDLRITGPTGVGGPTGPSVTGPTGPASTVTGPAGSIGVDGATGPTGPASTVTGPAGSIGVDGATGPTGPASTVTGPDGATGPTGQAGVEGPTGPGSTVTGPAGATGAQGPTGPSVTGPTGPVGQNTVATPTAFEAGSTVTGLDLSAADIHRLAVTGTTGVNVQGLGATAPDGTAVVVVNVGATAPILLQHATGPLANAQFAVPWQGDYELSVNGGSALLFYDSTSGVWRVV
jgi:hypothetical protein